MNVSVQDPFGVTKDQAMPFLASALNPKEMQERFNVCLTRMTEDRGTVDLKEIKVSRYKPKRRCVIEFKIDFKKPGAPPETMTLIGKVRSKHRCNTAFQRLDMFWNAGFKEDSQDGVSVPEPICYISEYHLWLQRKVPGQVATDLLMLPNAKRVVGKIAEAAHKLHLANLPTKRVHLMSDELQILQEKLPTLLEIKPHWSDRIDGLLEACSKLAANVPQPVLRGIHRDFYADQVIMDGKRLYIIDFDLYCQGDPALDIGNFMGHITEQSLRTLGNANALRDLERALEERFVELSGEKVRASVRAYATLTLVRHIYLSTLFAERQPFTETLFEICEKRLDVKR